jgi:aminopeptidase N
LPKFYQFAKIKHLKPTPFFRLNEGFSHLFQHLLADLVDPNLRLADFMTVVSMHEVAFPLDSWTSTHAMENSVYSTDDINAAFDYVTTEKGETSWFATIAACSPLFSLSCTGAPDVDACRWRGRLQRDTEALFVHQVSDHHHSCTKFTHQNHLIPASNHITVESDALKESFEMAMRSTGMYTFDIAATIRKWEEQKGYSLVTVAFNGSHFELQQWSFYADHEQTTRQCFRSSTYNRNCNSTWLIPVNFATAENPNFDDHTTLMFEDNPKGQTSQEVEFETPVMHIEAPEHSLDRWHVFNKQQTGYYRVNYDDNNWRALSEALSSPQFTQIHVMNRAQLIDDVFALVEASYFGYERAYAVMRYLVREDDYFPWHAGNRRLNVLYEAFGDGNEELNVSMTMTRLP